MRDLRLPLLGLAAWIGGLVAMPVVARPLPGLIGLLAGLVVLGIATGLLRRRPGARVTALAAGLVLLAVVAAAGFRAAQIRHNPVVDLAGRGAEVDVVMTITSDPRTVVEAHATQQLLLGQVRRVTGRGVTYTLRTPVVLLGDPSWARVQLGATVTASGRLAPADDSDASALFLARDGPRTVAGPSPWWRASGRVRAALRQSVASRPAAERAIVPALVDGDESGLDDALADDFRTTGLTHLLAVSGTNLTLVVGFLLLVARGLGVRGRWLHLVAVLGILGFVLLARTEPSVLRAAAMGGVGLLAMGHNGRGRALRGLGAAMVVLMLADPSLAISMGFALSVLATAGILLLGPPWRDALGRWLPRWVAEAIAVPAAAQLACTPLIAVISGQVSLVAVGANLLAEPAVGPATVLGLLGGLAGLGWAWLGRCCGLLASWCVGWIVLIARHGAALPTAAIGWGTGPVAIAVLVALTVALGLWLPRLLRRRGLGIACCVALVVVMLTQLPTPGWPPGGWAYVVCDVGQGDGMVLSVGPHAAVVVDAGPDPRPMGSCLDGLGIEQVPLVLFTHFDADHVTGAPAVFAHRHVETVWTTALQQPPHGVDVVRRAAASGGVTPVVAPWGKTLTIGRLTVQVLWPRTDLPIPVGASGTNEASVVLLVRTSGLSLLLTGDLEPESAERVAAEVPGLHVDVLKIPHHGSRYQDEDWLLSLHPKVAIASVGAHNDYGHPAASTLDPLTAAGVRVLRTDRDGSVAVVPSADGLRVVTH